MSMAVIAGLGNPGLTYRNTRHNAGFDLVDAFAKKHGAGWKRDSARESKVASVSYGGEKRWLLKPQTYMNASGRAVSAFLRYHKFAAAELLVLHDDANLSLGRIKLSRYGGDGGHNGVADLNRRTGGGFYRFRIGIGEKPQREMKLADYVLSRFTASERELLKKLRAEHLEQLELVLDKGAEHAMNFINQRNKHERNNTEKL